MDMIKVCKTALIINKKQAMSKTTFERMTFQYFVFLHLLYNESCGKGDFPLSNSHYRCLYFADF